MPIVSGGAGGGTAYTPPTARAQYLGNAVNIANNAFGFLTWNTLQAGTALLDLTTPAAPTVVTAGIYAVSIQVGGAAMTAGGYYFASLELDADGDDAQAGSVAPPPATAGNASPLVALTLAYYVPAGGKLKVQVTSRDGVAARDFTLLQAFVQRLS